MNFKFLILFTMSSLIGFVISTLTLTSTLNDIELMMDISKNYGADKLYIYNLTKDNFNNIFYDNGLMTDSTYYSTVNITIYSIIELYRLNTINTKNEYDNFKHLKQNKIC